METGRWRQCSVCHQLIPVEHWDDHPHVREERRGQSAFIQGDIESFVSPVDKSVISDRAQLREHNRKHGVTDLRDYGDGYFERKASERSADMRGTSAKARNARINTIREAIERHGG